jgi:hypothetical protein
VGFGCTELDTRYIDIDRHDTSRIDNLNRVAATLAASETSTTTWKIDPAHSIAEFKVKHIMIANVKGQFSNVSELCFWMKLTWRTLASMSPSARSFGGELS